jgi:hypothetical protein
MSTAPNSVPTPPPDVTLDGVTRRSTLKWMTLAWTGFAAATAAGLTATVRFLFPNVLFEPPTRFKCPCHGSGYYVSGINFEGPAPRPLERAEIGLSAEDGQIIVDKATRYLYERGQWTDPKAFVKMA